MPAGGVKQSHGISPQGMCTQCMREIGRRDTMAWHKPEDGLMLTLCSGEARLCDGISRRQAMCIGGLSAVGLSLPSLLAARERRERSTARAKSCIVLWMTGGPPQHETWDPKPDAPAEIR